MIDGRPSRSRCPRCGKISLCPAYVRVTEKKKRNFVRIGNYCPACTHFIGSADGVPDLESAAP